MALNRIRGLGRAAFVSVLLLGFSALTAAPARAQVMTQEVESGVKGTIGLGLIGAELGFAIPAIIGVDEVWPYIVFPSVGAAGGAVAGYFAIDANNENTAGVAVLAASLALVIPTVVLTVAALRYDPERDEESSSAGNGDTTVELGSEPYDYGDEVDGPGESAPPPSSRPLPPTEATDAPAPAAPAPATTTSDEAEPEARRRVRRTAPRAALSVPGTGLLRWSAEGVALAMPAIKAVPTYSAEELRQVGLSLRDQRTEIHVSVFSAAF